MEKPPDSLMLKYLLVLSNRCLKDYHATILDYQKSASFYIGRVLLLAVHETLDESALIELVVIP